MSSWLLSKPDPLFFKPSQGTDKPLGTAAENFELSFENDRLNEIGASKAESYSDVWGPIVDEINDKGGPLFRNPGNVVYNNRHYETRKNRIFDYVDQNQDLFPELQDIRTRDFDAQAQGLSQQARDEFNELDQRSPGLTNTLAQFGGSAAAFFRDPGMLVTMPAGLLNLGLKSLFGVAVREAGLGAGTEAINQVAVKQWYDELGYDYTYNDFLTRIGTAGAFGFALPYTIAGAGQGVKMTTNQMKKGLQVLKGAGAPETPAMRAAEQSIDRIEAIEAENPLSATQQTPGRLSDDEYEDGLYALIEVEQQIKDQIEAARVQQGERHEPVLDAYDRGEITLEERNAQLGEINKELGIKELRKQLQDQEKKIEDFVKEDMKFDEVDASLEHQTRTVEADEAVLFNELPNIPNTPTAPVSTSAFESLGVPVAGARDFDPDELGVDANLFQYKSGGDEYGVTEALRGITQWDQVRAGTALVYEFADGRKVVADGHQRLGLAKRIKDQDPNQDPKIHAYTLRQVDGWTAEEVRVIAALKNIAEGSGKPVDAAKILRVDPNKIDELNLPPQSALVRQARELVNLSDETFMMVINGVVPANYAAVVGRMIPDDPDLQEAALRVIASQEPSNEFQAQTMVGQVREMGAQKMTQDGLFGEEVFAESFFAERAKVLDRALKEIRKDKAAFNNITKNAERLEAEGNVLEKTNNERRINDEQKTLQLLQALANAKGPLSDALTAAARAARESGSYAGPTRKFLDDVRAAVTAGDLDRLTASDVGRFVDGASESRPGPTRAEPEIELFDEPAGQGVDRQTRQLENDFFPESEEVTLRSPIEEDNVDLAEIRMPIDDTMPNDQIRAQVQALTQENIPIIKNLIQRIDSKFGTESGDNVKDLAKVIQKASRPSILSKKPWHTAAHIRDSYRFKTVVEDFRDVPAIFDELLTEGISLVKIDTQKLFDPKEWGWRIIAFDLRMPNGQLVEWYLPIKELEAQKKAEGHLIFEEWRNKTDEELLELQDEYLDAIEKSFRGYDDAFQASLDRLGVTREEARAAWSNAEESISVAARNSLRSSGEITSPAAAKPLDQAPEALRTKVPSSAQSIARAEPGSIRATGTLDDITQPPDDIVPDLATEEFPTGRVIEDDDGELIVEMQTGADLKREFDHDQEVLDRFRDCVL